jgi:CDP-diglyceride synthetase
MSRLRSARLLLRVASVVTLAFALGHSMGGADSWSPSGETEVLQTMRTYQFDVAGATRTYFDFYVGFGWYIAVLLLLQAALLWQLSSIASEPGRVKPFVWTLLIGNIAGTMIVWRFIFVVPALFSLATVMCLALVLFASRRRPG